MLIYILFILFIIMLIASYKLFDSEISHPAVIFCFMYTVSIISAIYNISAWNITLEWKTFLILFLGGVEFIIVSYLVNIFFKKKKSIFKKNISEKGVDSFVCNKLFLIFIIIFSVILIWLLIINILEIAGRFGDYNNFTEAQTLFKSHTSYSNDASLPHYLLLMFKVLELSSYICLYSFLYNVINFTDEKFIRGIMKNIYYLVPAILYVLKELISSSRITIIQLGCAGTIMGLIIWYSKYNWKKKISFKFILSLVLVGIVCLVVFYYSAALIGRQNSKGMLDYITLYAGGSIECLNLYIKEFINNIHTMGRETFILLMQGLNKYNITNFDISAAQTAHLEFRFYNDIMIGNVYTAYRRWFADFGIWGIVVLNGFMSFVYNFVYYIFKHSGLKKYNHLLLIIFGYISFGLFLHPIDSYFYTSVFQITFGTNLVLFVVLYFLAFNISYDKKSKRFKLSL